MKLLPMVCTALLLFGCGDNDDDGPSGPYHPEGVGNACSHDSDCPTNNCYLGPGGGYCTSDCQDEGSTDQCPDDTVCKPIQGGQASCLLVCGSEYYCPANTTCDDRWCPSGSSCVSVSGTDLWACEPEPS